LPQWNRRERFSIQRATAGPSKRENKPAAEILKGSVMDASRWKKIKEVYDRALDLSGDEREGFLAEACGGDDDLRREVETLLAAHDDAGTFLQSPAVKVAAHEIVADEDTSPAPQLIGRELANYRIISLLGRGGMGEVYLAVDKRLHRKVALKLLPARFMNDAERVRRFEREASAASATNHPNIITIHEIGQVDGAHYIVTEFIDGQTLRQRMQTAKLSLNEVVDAAIQVAQASEGKFSTRWSPDGRYLAAMPINQRKLLLFDFTTKQWTELANINLSYPQWSRDGKYIYFRSSPLVLRIRISDRKIEQWTSMKDLRIAPSVFARWMGLAPDDSPMVLRDVGAQDIYALEWQKP
jgi:protein kinase-like protein